MESHLNNAKNARIQQTRHSYREDEAPLGRHPLFSILVFARIDTPHITDMMNRQQDEPILIDQIRTRAGFPVWALTNNAVRI